MPHRIALIHRPLPAPGSAVSFSTSLVMVVPERPRDRQSTSTVMLRRPYSISPTSSHGADVVVDVSTFSI